MEKVNPKIQIQIFGILKLGFSLDFGFGSITLSLVVFMIVQLIFYEPPITSLLRFPILH